MICPKCGFEQPDGAECMRCGIIISRYKGPFLGAAALRPPISLPAPLPAAGGEPAAMGAAGAAAGGTMYGGPPPGAGAPTFGMTQPAFRGSFDVGKILGESFAVYFKNLIPFALLTALTLSPLYLAQAYVVAAKDASAVAILSLLAVVVSAVLCQYLATAAITYGVFQQMRGRDTSIGDCLSRGLSYLLPILGLAFVQGLRIMLGYLLCVIPGILWTLQLAVSIPAAIEERTGISESMERSTYLTQGFRGEIFGILFVLGMVNFGAQLVVTLVAAKDQAVVLFLSGIKDLLYVGLSATATAVMYYRLRSIKESIDVDQIASVFA
jgi:hypothetical protein